MGIQISRLTENGVETRDLSELTADERLDLEWALMNGAGKFEKGN